MTQKGRQTLPRLCSAESALRDASDSRTSSSSRGGEVPSQASGGKPCKVQKRGLADALRFAIFSGLNLRNFPVGLDPLGTGDDFIPYKYIFL